MKKNLLLSFMLVASSMFAFAQTPFAKGNIVVVKVGNGTSTPGSLGSKTVLEEYNMAGTLVQTVSLSDSATAKSTNFTLTGSNNSEGQLNLSTNKNYLSLIGYNVAPEAALTAGSAQKIIVRIDSNAVTNFDTRTTTMLGNVRTVATTDGLNYYFGSSQGGIRYLPFGVTTEPATEIARTNVTNCRSLNIFNGATTADPTPNYTLYSTLSAHASLSMTRVGSVGTLPTTTFTSSGTTGHTAFPGITIASSTASILANFNLFDTNNDGTADLLYVCDNAVGANVIRKYSFNGTTWTLRGSVAAPAVYSIAVTKYSGTGGGYLIFVIAGATTTGAANNQVMWILDQAGNTNDISGSLATLVAPVGVNYGLRAISFTPKTESISTLPAIITLPVSLTSFTGKKTSNGNQLNWATASEINNQRFDILRSTDKDNFQVISSVNGKNKPSQYNYLDVSPAAGFNYYKLNQVDFDGTVTPSTKIVAINSDLSDKESTITVSNGILTYSINSNAAATSNLQIFDTNGRKVLAKDLSLTTGLTQGTLSVESLNTGVYVARLMVNGKAVTTKFVK